MLARAGIEGGDDLLERYARHERELEAGEYLPYRQVVSRALDAACRELGAEPTAAEREAFGASVGDWPAFPDSVDALARLGARFRLGAITNCDDDLFERSAERLGRPFSWVCTAQQARAYKPDPRAFEHAFARIGLPRERILHVAQGLYHDHVPARTLGLRSVWIDRRGDRAGWGASPPADAAPDATFPDMRSFADAALAG